MAFNIFFHILMPYERRPAAGLESCLWHRHGLHPIHNNPTEHSICTNALLLDMDVHHHILSMRHKPSLQQYLSHHMYMISAATHSLFQLREHLWSHRPGKNNRETKPLNQLVVSSFNPRGVIWYSGAHVLPQLLAFPRLTQVWILLVLHASRMTKRIWLNIVQQTCRCKI